MDVYNEKEGVCLAPCRWVADAYMKINPNVPQPQQLPAQQIRKAEQDVKPEKGIAEKKEVEYVPSSQEPQAVTYKKPKAGIEGTVKPDADVVASLKEASEQRFASLRRMVEDLLRRQGMTFLDIADGKTVEVDETARAEAQAAIADGGEFSAEAVSDRIVEFAKAISGGDKSKLQMLIGAIDEGFSQARKALGGELPEISQKTYDLIMQKLDAWQNEE